MRTFKPYRPRLPAMLAALMCLALMHGARADTVTNGSFEQPTVGGGFVTLPAGSSSLTGWTISNGTVGVAPDSIDHIGNYWQAADGNQSVDLDGSPGDSNEAAAISQTLSLTPGQSYLLTFAMAGNPDDGNTLKTVDVTFGSVSNVFTFINPSATHSNMGWTYQSLYLPGNLVTGSALLKFDSGTPGWYGPALDDVRVTAVPTPSAALGGFAVFGLIGAAKLRRSRRSLLV